MRALGALGAASAPLSFPRRLLPSYPRYRGNLPGSPSPAPPPLPPELLGSRLPPPAMELLAAALSAACALDQDGSAGQPGR